MSFRLTEAQARALGIDPGRPGAKTIRGSATRSAPANALQPLIGERKPRRKGGRMTLPESSDFCVSFSVPMEPRTKQRPRATVSVSAIVKAFVESRGDLARFKAAVEKVCPRVYTDAQTRSFEQNVATLAALSMKGKSPVKSPVRVHVAFHLTGDVLELPTDVTDPDLDNLEKALLDSLNGIVYHDDRLVCWKTTSKECAPVARIDVRVESVALSERDDTCHRRLKTTRSDVFSLSAPI